MPLFPCLQINIPSYFKLSSNGLYSNTFVTLLLTSGFFLLYLSLKIWYQTQDIVFLLKLNQCYHHLCFLYSACVMQPNVAFSGNSITLLAHDE